VRALSRRPALPPIPGGGSRSLRIRCGEQQAHGRALGHTVERGASGPDRVHHGPYVVHARLEGWRAPNAVRHPGAALVEADQPRERPDALEEGCPPGNRGLDLEVTHEPGNEHDVERAVAADLVGDMDLAALRIARLRFGHARSVQRRHRQRNIAPVASGAHAHGSPSRTVFRSRVSSTILVSDGVPSEHTTGRS
jgi:hypothetical protein